MPATTTPVNTTTARRADICVGHLERAMHRTSAGWDHSEVLPTSNIVTHLVSSEVFDVDDLTADHVVFLPAHAGVVIASNGPLTGVVPEALQRNFQRTGLASLLRSLDIPHAWKVPNAAAAIATGDSADLDPGAGAVWVLRLPGDV